MKFSVKALKSPLKHALAFALGISVLSGCGFHLPNQSKLSQVVPEVNVTGDYHDSFYKMVVSRLKANGVKVNDMPVGYTPKKEDTVPTLTLPSPQVTEAVVSVDSRAQALERSYLVSSNATLFVPYHRPIVMHNSITRNTINKPGQTLAADVEKNTVITETKSHLADELILRLSYLGRATDPNNQAPIPGELVIASGESNDDIKLPKPADLSGLTLIEALQQQSQYERDSAKSVSLDELNNGQKILNNSYKLPPVKPKLLHRAPDNLNID